jgi:hypothetical protein
MNPIHFTSARLSCATDINDQIEKINADLKALLVFSAPAKSWVKTAKKNRFTAAGLARLRATQKARWAKIKAGESERLAAVKPR